MFTNLALSLLIVLSLMGLTGCGATDSGHADNQSAQSSSVNPGNGSGGSTTVPPVILEQPIFQSVYQDESVQINVAASGEGIDYQWQKAIDNTWVDLRGEDTESLEFSFITSVDTGLYRVEVANTAGAVYSDAVELIVKEKLSIVAAPVGGNRNQSSSMDFSVDVAGEAPYRYQWYRNSTALSENAKYVGTQTDHLVVNALTVSDAGSYKVVVTNDDGQSVESSAAVLTVNGPAQIISNPSDISVEEGKSKYLSVSAGGTGPISYQWQKRSGSGWSDISGAVYNTLWISNASASDAGEYRCLVTNIVGSVDYSDSATVSVLSPVSITSQPANVHGSSHRVAEGVSVSYSVVASGTDVSYEWRKGNSLVHTGSTFNLGQVNLSDAGTYTCRAQNAVNAVNCNSVSLVVLSPVSIASHPASRTFVEDDSGSLSVSVSGTAPFTYQWQKSFGSGWQNVPGATASVLSLNGINASDAADYRVVVNNEVGQAATSQAASVDVIERVRITQQPVDLFGSSHRVAEGASVSYSVAASGTDVTYEWYKGNSLIHTGAALNLGSVGVSDAGTYTCRARNSASSVNCNTVSLVVLSPVVIATQPESKTLVAGDSGSLSVTATGTAPFTYQWQKTVGSAWQNVSDATAPTLSFGVVDAAHAADYRVIVNNEVGQAVTSYTARVDVIERVSITQQPADLYGGEYRGVVGESITMTVAASGTDVSYAWYKNGSLVTNGASLSLSAMTAADAGVYRCEATNSVDSQQCSPVEVVILTPPSILSQSSGASVFEGAGIAFEVQVAGSPVPTIQWFKDGVQMSGKTSATLDFGGASLEEEGSYTCEVSNEAGSVSCSAMNLEVKEIVRISSSPSNQVLSSGSNATLSVVATGEAPLTYTWYKDGDVYQSGVDLDSISLSNVEAVDDGAYHVSVSNEGSGATSSIANITVLAPVRGTARLSWEAPFERSNGGDLDDSEIHGYKVYKRLDDGSFDEVAYVTNGQTFAEIDDLEVGIHYFALTTVDTNDMESGMSSVVAVTISDSN